MDKPPSIVLRYYLYEATVTFGFFWPIFTIFLLDRGLSFTQIALLNSLSAALIVVGEIPTGYVGDRIGRRNSLLVSSILFSASVLAFVVARSFLAFVLIWLVWSFAQTFRSGSNEAWLYEILEDRFDEDRFVHIRGRGGAVNLWVSAGSMAVAGLLYELEPTLPFLLGGLLNVVGVFVVLSLPQNRQYEDGTEEPFTVLDAVSVIRERLTVPPLRSFVLYMAVFFGVITGIDEFIQPITVDTIGLPESTLGPLYASFTILAAVISQYAGAIEDALSTRWAIVLIPLFVGTALSMTMLVPILALPAFYVAKVGRTLMGPIASGFVADRTDAVGRATVLSAVSMVYALFRVPLQPLGGVVADMSTALTAVGLLGGVLLVAFLVVHLIESPAGDTSTPSEGQSASTD